MLETRSYIASVIILTLLTVIFAIFDVQTSINILLIMSWIIVICILFFGYFPYWCCYKEEEPQEQKYINEVEP